MAKVKAMRQNERLREYVRPMKGSLNGSYEVLISTSKVVDGIVRKCAELTTIDPKEQFSQWKASDFALENILAAGAVDLLKDCGNVGYDNLRNAEMCDAAVASMETEINNNVNNTAE